MTRAEATRLAKAKYGKNAFIEENKKAVDPETRAIIRKELEKLKGEEPKAPPPTPEQLAHRKAWKEWKEQKERLFGLLMSSKRYRIGEIKRSSPIGPYATIHGDGDSWDEAAEQAKLIGESK